MNKKINSQDFYTIGEVMEILQLSRMTIYRYLESWKLTAYKFWRDYRIRKEDFESFLEAHKQ